MIFSSTYNLKADPLVRGASSNSATGRDRNKDRPREDPPRWSTLQQIPQPEGRVALLNDYIMSQIAARKDRSDKSNEVEKKYQRPQSSELSSVGSLFSAVA